MREQHFTGRTSTDQLQLARDLIFTPSSGNGDFIFRLEVIVHLSIKYCGKTFR